MITYSTSTKKKKDVKRRKQKIKWNTFTFMCSSLWFSRFCCVFNHHIFFRIRYGLFIKNCFLSFHLHLVSYNFVICTGWKTGHVTDWERYLFAIGLAINFSLMNEQIKQNKTTINIAFNELKYNKCKSVHK